jgi:Bacterial Ig-like domain (group 3)
VYHPGDTNFLTSTSAAVSLTVNPAQIAVSLISSQNPSVYGQIVTFTATVPSGVTGTIQFRNGAVNLGGPVTIAAGVAAFATSTLAPGTHSITAIYNGDTNFAAANSVVLSQVVVSVADFAVASSTGQQLIPPGASANFTIVVSSMNGLFTNAVTMSASNLPPGATYTFSPAAVTPGAAGVNTTLTVSVPNQSSMASRGRRLGPAALALLLLPFAYLKRYRWRPQRLMVWILVGLTSLGVVSGCGEGGYFSQTEQTYTITVTGTSGNVVRSTTVTLTVE